jgi:hypothetical protein
MTLIRDRIVADCGAVFGFASDQPSRMQDERLRPDAAPPLMGWTENRAAD